MQLQCCLCEFIASARFAVAATVTAFMFAQRARYSSVLLYVSALEHSIRGNVLVDMCSKE